jgi:hypothetical protein
MAAALRPGPDEGICFIAGSCCDGPLTGPPHQLLAAADGVRPLQRCAARSHGDLGGERVGGWLPPICSIRICSVTSKVRPSPVGENGLESPVHLYVS